MIISQLGELDFVMIADKLLENKQIIIQFFKHHNWLLSDMTSQWSTDRDGYIVYGKITENLLRKTKGVTIYPNHGEVFICHFNQYGNYTKPYIRCEADKFIICE
jgi:hypothetical protein